MTALAAKTLIRACAARIAAVKTIMGFLGITLHLLPFFTGAANTAAETGSSLTNGAAPQPALFGCPGFLRPLITGRSLLLVCHSGAGGK